MNNRQMGILGIIGAVLGTAGLTCFLTIGYNSLKSRQELHQICLSVTSLAEDYSKSALDKEFAISPYERSEQDPILKQQMKRDLVEYQTERKFWDEHYSRLRDLFLTATDMTELERDYSGITSCKDFVNRYNSLNRFGISERINPDDVCYGE
jgi:hypothetical protein